jgi:sugar O-acyltransferase (sialic acid O-acetyltransferase NeuD family)
MWSRCCAMPEIVVLGGGGHAKVLVSIIKKLGYQVVGYLDPEDRGKVGGVAWVGDDSMLQEILRRHPVCHAALGLGKVDAASDRRIRLLGHLEHLGFTLPMLVSPRACVNEEVELGTGTVVFDGAVINSGTKTGRGCIINTNSTVEHDCRLGDDVHVAPGAILSGGVTVGDQVMVGAGATVIQGVRIGPHCLVGAGSIVVRDLVEPGIYMGNPCKRSQ